MCGLRARFAPDLNTLVAERIALAYHGKLARRVGDGVEIRAADSWPGILEEVRPLSYGCPHNGAHNTSPQIERIVA